MIFLQFFAECKGQKMMEEFFFNAFKEETVSFFGIFTTQLGKKSKLFILDTKKPIFNNQIGSGPCAHTKFLSATRCKVSKGPKMSRKTDFQ